MTDIMKTFGSKVFNDKVMKERLSDSTYNELHKTLKNGTSLNPKTAAEIAEAMKQWAIDNGATHFTHWFHPLSGATAEKHESFVSTAGGGKIKLEFSPGNLVKGEADASSFPSGGLRDTFEARGYTAWDPTSYAFIKDGILCLPTVFASYSGEALDHKTPLLRSMNALNTQAMRILHLFGNENVDHVKTTVGAEQEYFLIDKKYYDLREDLRLTGRTLFGAMPPKGQEMHDHYYGSIKTRVSGFMKDLNEELWALGIQAKTEHNEVAPSQHELANNFLTTNVSVDQNNLTMEVMKKTAKKHGFECLLHEKPYAGVNGSGKHNNWSMKTDTGVNLLEPGDTPSENAQFLLFLVAVIKAVDEYQDLIRISIASAGNDHRLGASEAPPAIVSVFLGKELTEILENIENDEVTVSHGRTPFRVNISTIPAFPKDNTDRNRTSPFAFTGNKFEFRMPGSSASVATPNTVLNTVIAEELKKFADELEDAPGRSEAIHALIKRTIQQHKRIIFNGNGYDASWISEAARRGLSNYASTPEALAHYLDPENIKVFTDNGVLSEKELQSRYEIYLEKYWKTINIEAKTMLDMLKKDMMPAALKQEDRLMQTLRAEKELGLTGENEYALNTLKRVRELLGSLSAGCTELGKTLSGERPKDAGELAFWFRDEILPRMSGLRKDADELELICDRELWPIPTYRELLFGGD
ncbi:MAG: glutamine synthetase III [Erysipelotrichaceae bacterium]|nr:glutamine synthetase III [Erysipelotrichaceae bacterium]MBR3168276.1 glutamine synthetase III [Erysipelotrichaceae bacterium]